MHKPHVTSTNPAKASPTRPVPLGISVLVLDPDRHAGLLVAADGPDTETAQAAEHELDARYVGDERLHPGPTVMQYSPLGDDRIVEVDISGIRR